MGERERAKPFRSLSPPSELFDGLLERNIVVQIALLVIVPATARRGRLGRAATIATRAGRRRTATTTAIASAHIIIRGTADRIITIARHHSQLPTLGGEVGIIAAGTSDLPAADEAAAVCRELGCNLHRVTDVGVAGLHRLFEPLRQLLLVPVDVIIVAAGMDGALPSVVTGLVDMPVIGLPTAVGYGFGGAGHAALGTMLQSCAPGITVVNIDNGIGAGAAAARIARKLFLARTKGTSA